MPHASHITPAQTASLLAAGAFVGLGAIFILLFRHSVSRAFENEEDNSGADEGGRAPAL